MQGTPNNRYELMGRNTYVCVCASVLRYLACLAVLLHICIRLLKNKLIDYPAFFLPVTDSVQITSKICSVYVFGCDLHFTSKPRQTKPTKRKPENEQNFYFRCE